MLPERIKRYQLIGLSGSPEVFVRLLETIDDPDALDARPDSDRFTVREVLAHLADWEPILRKRLHDTLTQDKATLQGYDEGQVAIDNDYAHTDPNECAARYKRERVTTMELLHSIQPEQWERIGVHTEVGPITVEQQVALIAAHDAYHLQQVIEWTRLG